MGKTFLIEKENIESKSIAGEGVNSVVKEGGVQHLKRPVSIHARNNRKAKERERKARKAKKC